MHHYVKSPQDNGKYKYGLCECCVNPRRACYINCCFCCAVADLSLVVNPCCIKSKKLRWVAIAFLAMCFLAAPPLLWILTVYIAFNASMEIANRIGYETESCGPGCCCSYWCCFCCKICQVANQLEADKDGIQSPKTVELCTEINQDALLKNSLCKVNTPTSDYAARV
jgi:hypothetical protein